MTATTSTPIAARDQHLVDRRAFTGSCSDVMDDIDRTKTIGATELILDFHASANSVDELVDTALCLTVPMLAAA